MIEKDSQHISRAIFWIIMVSFLANFVWEIVQMPLYAVPGTIWQHLPMCIYATWGDVFIILMLYIVVAMIRSDLNWFRHIEVTDVVILALGGALIAISIEQRALATHAWQYTASMSLIPFLNVGLVPILQMMVLSLVIFFCVGKIVREEGV